MISFTERSVLAIELNDEDSLQQITHTLLRAEINIHSLYPFLHQPNGKSVVAIAMEDQVTAEEALSQNHISILNQEDFLRRKKPFLPYLYKKKRLISVWKFFYSRSHLSIKGAGVTLCPLFAKCSHHAVEPTCLLNRVISESFACVKGLGFSHFAESSIIANASCVGFHSFQLETIVHSNNFLSLRVLKFLETKT